MNTSEKILAFTAIFISCLALVVSIVQTRISQKQSEAAVWPRLTCGQSVGPDYHKVIVRNEGVGPAIIKSVAFNYRDTSFQLVNKMIHYFGKLEAKATNKNLSLNFTYSNPYPGGVYGVGDEDELFVAQDSTTVLIGKKYVEEMEIVWEYCSIYDHCWRMVDHETSEIK